MKIIRTKNKKEEGQALVEFALILPIFLLLVVAIIDFGWIFYNTSKMTNVAREAARIIAVEKTTNITDLEGTMINNLDKNLYIDQKITIDIKPNENSGSGYRIAKVNISGQLKSLTGLLPESFQTIRANAYMRLEHD